LASQVSGRGDLVYYDWELTGQRSRQLRAVRQLLALALNKPMPTYELPAHQWLLGVDKKLGNAITEVSLAGPRELKFVRRSDLGLSAVELIALFEWIGPPDPANALPPLKP
jgi:hypothetical protein